MSRLGSTRNLPLNEFKGYWRQPTSGKRGHTPSTYQQTQREQSRKSRARKKEALRAGRALPCEGPARLLHRSARNGLLLHYPDPCPVGRPGRYGSATHHPADLLFSSLLSRTRQ